MITFYYFKISPPDKMREKIVFSIESLLFHQSWLLIVSSMIIRYLMIFLFIHIILVNNRNKWIQHNGGMIRVHRHGAIRKLYIVRISCVSCRSVFICRIYLFSSEVCLDFLQSLSDTSWTGQTCPITWWKFQRILRGYPSILLPFRKGQEWEKIKKL